MKSLPGFTTVVGLLLLLRPLPSCGEESAVPKQPLANIAYKASGKLSEYETERCKLDLHLPPGGKNFATLVWFHGGGLKGGSKDGAAAISRAFAADGVAVAAVNYRLSPKATYPAYLEDSAAAVAWVRVHIAEHGGDPAKVFISGHSAGGYLTVSRRIRSRATFR